MKVHYKFMIDDEEIGEANVELFVGHISEHDLRMEAMKAFNSLYPKDDESSKMDREDIDRIDIYVYGCSVVITGE